jgi:DNA-binding MarR family transcriptional regulator
MLTKGGQAPGMSQSTSQLESGQQSEKSRMHSPKRVVFLDLVLSLFRLNGLLIAEGDRMTRDLGLTSARWRVIGAVALSSGGLTVPGIARVLGQSRQAVQRIADTMVEDGLLVFVPNPKHKKSMLVHLTEEGKRCYNLLREEQDPWALQATEDIPLQDLETSLIVLRRLIKKFDKK